MKKLISLAALLTVTLTVTEIYPKEDKIVMRWTVADDLGSATQNGSGEFAPDDQGVIDAALKTAIASYDNANALRTKYISKTVSIDSKDGTLVVTPVLADAQKDVP